MEKKLHTTNYYNTFITAAEDCPATIGEIPTSKSEAPTIAALTYEIINSNPYKYTSDDVLFKVYAQRNDIEENDTGEARQDFFSKGQPCLRASPLTKRLGWGIHHDENGKIALYGMETPEYKKLSSDKNLKIVKGMRSAKK